MASIKGVKLTGAQSHAGLEGYTLYANVSVDGKKVGYVCDDAYGGPWDIGLPDAVQEEVTRRYREYAEETGKLDEMALFDITEDEFVERKAAGTLPKLESFDVESFFAELAELGDLEKSFKKALKKGYKALVDVRFYPRVGGLRMPYQYYTSGTDASVERIRKEAEAKCKTAYVTQYKSLGDFVL